MSALDPKAAFADAVARGTGLQGATVAAWVRAENGANNNFLGLKNTSGQFETFGSWQDAAAATITRLQEAQYAPILATAQATSDPKTQLAAIAESPWDTGKSGPKPSYLKLLLGSLSANQTTAPASSSSGGGGGGWFSGGLLGGLETGLGFKSILPGNKSLVGSGIAGGVEKWVQSEAATALAYVVLTVLGLALLVFGALDFLGYSPKRVAENATAPLRSPTLFAEA